METRQAHIVLAHPEPGSYNAHLARTARETLERAGWNVTVSDLCAMGFDPCEGPAHYSQRQNPDRFDVQAEQKHATDSGTLPVDVQTEIAHLDRAELVILQYPMWWHLPPAVLKGWFDRVFPFGEVYTSKKRFEAGRFAGKKALLSVTVGTSRETYQHNGRSADINMILWPVQFSLAYVGFDILPPFIAYGVEGGLRYSDSAAITARLEQAEKDYSARLENIQRDEAVPFNTMNDWGPDGRIRPDAPVFSPFIRHKEHLEIE